MARPRSDRLLDQFTTGDLAVASGVGSRNIALLNDVGLLPRPSIDAEGQSGHRIYDYATLKRVAAVGALHSAGVEILLAARLLDILQDDFGGETPSNMRYCLDLAMRSAPGKAPWPPSVEGVAGFSRGSEFWVHHALSTYGGGYVPGAALAGDACVEIADRAYVTARPLGDLPRPLSVAANVRLRANPIAKIRNWVRGSGLQIEDLGDLIGNFDFEECPENRARMRRLEIEFEAAFENAVGVLRINLSLAIRRALDRLAMHRGLVQTPGGI